MYGPPQAVTDAQELEVWLVLHFLKYGEVLINKNSVDAICTEQITTIASLSACHALFNSGRVFCLRDLLHTSMESHWSVMT